MYTEDDLVKEYITYNTRISKEEVRDLLNVVLDYIRYKLEDEKTEALELPFVGFLYKKADEYEEAIKTEVGTRRYLKRIYSSDKPLTNLYDKSTILSKVYEAKNKKELQETLNNPSFKIKRNQKN